MRGTGNHRQQEASADRSSDPSFPLLRPSRAISVPVVPGRALVVAPHPDDETLGAGGILHDLGARGWSTEVVVVSDGSKSHPDVAELSVLREAECRRACGHLGVKTVTFLGFPDGGLSERLDQITAALTTLLDGVDIVIGPTSDDRHDDHQACARSLDLAVHSAEPSLLIWSYGVWIWDIERFGHPDLTDAREFAVSGAGQLAKRAAMAEYVSQCSNRFGAPIVPEHLVERICNAHEVFW